MKDRIITETPQVIELKKLLKEAVEILRSLKESFWSSAYGEMADELSRADEFLDKIKEVEL
jgi:hypothetical protein